MALVVLLRHAAFGIVTYEDVINAKCINEFHCLEILTAELTGSQRFLLREEPTFVKEKDSNFAASNLETQN